MFMNQGKLEVVKQEMARMNIDILEISELKWTGLGNNPLEEMEQPSQSTKSQKRQNDLGSFPRQFNITAIQDYASTTNAEEAEQFYEDLQDLLELTPQKDVLFIIGDWNAKIGSQETTGIKGKFGLGVQNETEQRLRQFCQENTLVIANTLFPQHKRRLYTQTSPYGKYQNQIDYILFS